MARLWSSGFELNSTTANVEFGVINGAGTSIQTTTVRSGTYAGRCNPSSSSGYFEQIFSSSVSGADFYFRAYIRFASFPSADCKIFGFQQSGTTSGEIRFINSTSKLRVRDNAGTQIGSDSAALSTNTWYMIEFMHGDTSTTMKARLDGVEFAASTSVTAAQINTVDRIRIGPQTSCNADMFIDDMAINNNSGSFQNSYPGEGEIIHLLPNATGDANDFNVQVGGTAGAANNYTRVNEVTPNDATSYNGSKTTNHTDDLNLAATPATMDSDDTINVVQVGIRFAEDTTGAQSTFNIRIKKASAGTISSSSTITPGSTTYTTNAPNAPKNYSLTLYQDPDSSNWTKSTLDTAQIGYKIVAGNANSGPRISTVWLLVDHKPTVAGTAVKDIIGSGLIPFSR